MTRDRRSLHSIMRSTAVLFVLMGGLPTPAAHAATWWFGGTGTAAWDSTANWFSAAVSGTNPASVPNALTEDVIFNVTANNALKTYVYTDVGQSANSLTVDASGTTYFGRASTGASTLTVGSGGMTLGSTAGPVIFTGSSAPYAPITSSVMTVTAGADSLPIVNNSPSAVVFAAGIAVTPSVSSTIALQGTGAGGVYFVKGLQQGTSGTISVSINMPNAMVLFDAVNSYLGVTTLTSGTLGLGATGAIGSGSSQFVINGGAITQKGSAKTYVNSISVGGDFAVAVGGTLGAGGTSFSQNNPITLSGPIDLTGSTRTITLKNAFTAMSGTITNGGLAFSGAATGTVALSGNNSYADGTTLNGSFAGRTLAVGNINALGTGPLAVNAGTVSLGTTGVSVGLFSGSAGTTITTNSSAIVALTTTAASNSTFGGAITNGAGTVALAKAGAGTLTLGGSSSYTGGTTIIAGGITASNPSALGTGSVTLAANTTLGVTSGTLSVGAFSTTGGATISLGGLTNGILSTGGLNFNDFGSAITVGGSPLAGTSTLVSGASLAGISGLTLTGAGVGNATISLNGSQTVGRNTYQFTSVGNSLQLVTTADVLSLTWDPGVPSGSWNTTATNWLVGGTGSGVAFTDADNVAFNSAATVSVPTAVSPSTMSITNATGVLDISGAGSITASTLSRSASGAAAISSNVTVASGVIVSGGSLATNGTLGITNGGITVNGGALTTGSTTVVTAGGLSVSGGLFTSNGVVNASAGGLNVSGGQATLNAASTINDGITVTGGTVALNASNTISGVVAVSSGGVLSLGDTGGVGSGSISLNNGTLASTLASGTLANAISVGSGGGTLSGANSLTLTGAIAGTGPLTKTGAGEFVVAGLLGTSSGPMSVSVAAGSSLRLTGTTVKYLSGTVNPGVNDGTLTFDNVSITTMGGTIAAGAGTIVVSGSSSLTGLSNTGFATIATPISGAGSLTIDATTLNRVILSGSNSYSGGTFLNRNVGITNGFALGSGPITLIALSTQVSRITNDGLTALTLANAVNTGATALALSGSNALVLTGTISGTGNIRAVNGIADLTQQTAATMLNTGTVEMNSGGQVWVNSASNLGSNTSISFSGSTQTTLVAKGNTGVINQNVFFGSNPGVTAAIDTGGYTMTLGGTLADLYSGTAGSFVKTGAGTLILTANNTYTGDTTVSAGTLLVNGALSTGTAAGTTTVAAGATLAGTGTIGSATTIQSGATLSPGASPGTLTFTQGVVWSAGGDYNWQMLSATGTAGLASAWDLASIGGTLAISSTSVDPFKINLWTLSGTGPDVSGPAANFSAAQNGSWKIASAAGGITGFAADKFLISTSATNGTGGFANSLSGGTFSIAQSGNDLNLVFTSSGTQAAITINVASGTQTQAQAGYPLLSGATPVIKTGLGTLVLDQANSLTGSTTVQQGVLQMANSAALSLSRLVVVAGGTGQVAPSTSTNVASLDLTANGLVDVTSGALTIGSGLSAAQLVVELLEGRSGGTWTGTSGITSSVAAANVASSVPRAVGWLDNGNGSLTVAYAAPGDTNLDWSVDILDVANFLALGKFDSGQAATWLEGDFNYDGVVDILDAASFASTGLFNAGNYNTSPGTTGAIAAVPEPATWALLAGALAFVVGHVVRRRCEGTPRRPGNGLMVGS